LESEESSKQMLETINAIQDLNYQTILIYPNADAGGKGMINVIKQHDNLPFLKTFKSIPRKDFLSLMNVADVIIGNSSSAIIEAPSFKLPAVNIGSRQKGRERSSNVLDVDYDSLEIKSAVEKALFDKKFKNLLNESKNPYGDGNTSSRVVKILGKIPLNDKLLEKRLNL